MAECVGYNGKGVTLEGFDTLVDKLVSVGASDLVLVTLCPLSLALRSILSNCFYFSIARLVFTVKREVRKKLKGQSQRRVRSRRRYDKHSVVIQIINFLLMKLPEHCSPVLSTTIHSLHRIAPHTGR